MDEEYLNSLKEVFFKQYLHEGNDAATINENREIAGKIYDENYKKLEKYEDMLKKGITFDQTDVILAVQLLGLSAFYKKKFN